METFLTGGLGADILSGAGSDSFLFPLRTSTTPQTSSRTSPPALVVTRSIFPASHHQPSNRRGRLEEPSSHTHGYVSFAQSGLDTLVQYDRDGTVSMASTVATLTGVNASDILRGTQLLLSPTSSSSSTSQTRTRPGRNSALPSSALFGAAPTADVTLTITGGDQIIVNGSSGASTLTFTADNWWTLKTSFRPLMIS